MILVRHAMSESPQSAGPDLNAADAAAMMRDLDVGVIPVAEGERLIGLVTDRDLTLRVLAERKDATEVKLGDIMTRSPVSVSPDARISEARDLMAEHQIRRVPVLKGEQLVGILSLGDLALADASKRAVGEALEEVSGSDSTAEMSDYPERGTPSRVRERGG